MAPKELRELWISHLKQPYSGDTRINSFMNSCLVAEMEHHVYRDEKLLARAQKLRQDWNDWVHNEFELKAAGTHPSEDKSLDWIYRQLEAIRSEER
jgi:hypothetical protein